MTTIIITSITSDIVRSILSSSHALYSGSTVITKEPMESTGTVTIIS